MKGLLALLVGLVLCHSGFAQQAGSCNPNDQNNPCSPLREAGRYHYAYMHSNQKFVQCNAFGGCFEMPCAPGTVFSYQYRVCVHGVPSGGVTQSTKTVTVPDPPCKLYFRQVSIQAGWNNLQQYVVQFCGCTLLRTFYGLSLDECQQKSCDLGGNAINYFRTGAGSYTCEVRRCSNGNLQLYNRQTSSSGTYSVYTSAFTCAAPNPCTLANRQARKYYHEHFNRYKFVQCDDHGGCFEMPCGAGTAWSQKAYTCDHA